VKVPGKVPKAACVHRPPGLPRAVIERRHVRCSPTRREGPSLGLPRGPPFAQFRDSAEARRGPAVAQCALRLYAWDGLTLRGNSQLDSASHRRLTLELSTAILDPVYAVAARSAPPRNFSAHPEQPPPLTLPSAKGASTGLQHPTKGTSPPPGTLARGPTPPFLFGSSPHRRLRSHGPAPTLGSWPTSTPATPALTPPSPPLYFTSLQSRGQGSFFDPSFPDTEPARPRQRIASAPPPRPLPPLILTTFDPYGSLCHPALWTSLTFPCPSDSGGRPGPSALGMTWPGCWGAETSVSDRVSDGSNE